MMTTKPFIMYWQQNNLLLYTIVLAIDLNITFPLVYIKQFSLDVDAIPVNIYGRLEWCFI